MMCNDNDTWKPCDILQPQRFKCNDIRYIPSCENIVRNPTTIMEVENTRKILTRLWTVLVRDGEQFVAGEIKKIAEENGIIL